MFIPMYTCARCRNKTQVYFIPIRTRARCRNNWLSYWLCPPKTVSHKYGYYQTSTITSFFTTTEMLGHSQKVGTFSQKKLGHFHSSLILKNVLLLCFLKKINPDKC